MLGPLLVSGQLVFRAVMCGRLQRKHAEPFAKPRVIRVFGDSGLGAQNARQFQTVFAGAGDRVFITRIRMTPDTTGRIVPQHAL
jgi:hypothetical protein